MVWKYDYHFANVCMENIFANLIGEVYMLIFPNAHQLKVKNKGWEGLRFQDKARYSIS